MFHTGEENVFSDHVEEGKGLSAQLSNLSRYRNIGQRQSMIVTSSEDKSPGRMDNSILGGVGIGELGSICRSEE